ncbi:hypothetical protein KUTeg_008548 [Tegillarca granosa]|uniref:TRIM56 n=1 Tax=Tegillarca granosa TaxID=220873 RepID=A0ABQ9F9E9_TEGGR|nr:hypothetical protein KUTeg_008548 [Tegillarca granosa]
MAEANDNSDTGEEFLKCPICLEFYVDPKFLPCLHTFCRSCLQTYISSSIKEEEISESKTKVDFPCPVCRTIVTSPYSGEIEIEDLSSKFPTHQTINSLLDKHNLEANVTYCNSCLVEKRENPAKTWCKVCNEAFCEECTKWHRKITALKSHKLTQLSDMNINEMDITRLEFCDIHKDEVLRAFCKDHEKACCLPCLTIEHRKCVDVINLEEAAAGIKEMEETQEFLKRLRESEQFLSEMLRKRKQNISNLETRKNNILAEITAFRKRLDKHFDNLEDKLKEDVVSKQKTSLLEEKDYISDLESKYATILNYRKLLEACLNKASEIHNFLEIKRLINKTKMFGKELKSCADDMKEIDLEMCFQAEIQNVVSTLSLGTVEVRVKSPKINTDFLNSKIFADSRVCKILSFQLPKTIQSATFLKNGNLIIAMDRLFVCLTKMVKRQERK